MIRYLASSLTFLGATLCLTAATAGTYTLCIGEYWLDGRHFGAICPAASLTPTAVRTRASWQHSYADRRARLVVLR
jgi:hypothetical protein